MSTSPTRKKEAGARVRYNPRSEDIGAVIERYGIPEFTYHTWRNPELERRYESSSPTASSELVKESARLSNRGASRSPVPVASPAVNAPDGASPVPVVAPSRAPPSAPAVTPVKEPVMSAVRASGSAPAAAGRSAVGPEAPKSGPKVSAQSQQSLPVAATLSDKGASMRLKAPAAAPTPLLVAWNEPEDLMTGPLPLLSHQPDCRAWVKSLSDRPARAIVSIAEPVSYQESRHLHAITTLEEEPSLARPVAASRPSNRGSSPGTPTPAEQQGLRLISSVEMHASHPIGRKEDAFEVYPPLPRSGAHHHLEATRSVEDVLLRFLPEHDEGHQGHVSLSSVMTRPEPGMGKPLAPRITGGPRRPLKRASQPAGVEVAAESSRAGITGPAVTRGQAVSSGVAGRGGVNSGLEAAATVSAPSTRHPLAPRVSRPVSPAKEVALSGVATAPTAAASSASAAMPAAVALPGVTQAASAGTPRAVPPAVAAPAAVSTMAQAVAQGAVPAAVPAVASATTTPFAPSPATLPATSPASAPVVAPSSRAAIAPVVAEAQSFGDVAVPHSGGSVEASAPGVSVSPAVGTHPAVPGRTAQAVTSPAPSLSATSAAP